MSVDYKRCEWGFCNYKVRWHLSVKLSTGGTREAEFCTGHAADAMTHPECSWTRFVRIEGIEEEE
ncbi:hypothetical protein GCM10022252_19980 [Streptosporangium oxazolinicum]|uniref:Uncharacterized protein n=1 Tax=Streptosporangium oxazolinicum TaxID=909287 RepID=A0ABP8APD5_9ACTN